MFGIDRQELGAPEPGPPPDRPLQRVLAALLVGAVIVAVGTWLWPRPEPSADAPRETPAPAPPPLRLAFDIATQPGPVVYELEDPAGGRLPVEPSCRPGPRSGVDVCEIPLDPAWSGKVRFVVRLRHGPFHQPAVSAWFDIDAAKRAYEGSTR